MLGEQRLEVAQQRELARVARAPLAGQSDLVEPEPGLARGALVEREASASAMRSSVGVVSAPWRSSVRKRAYARSTAGEPAITPRKFGSCPAAADALLSSGSDAAGAVRSSWIWNLLIAVFMVPRILAGNGCRPGGSVAHTYRPYDR